MGGLTYAAACQEDGAICHVPKPGEPDNVWWFGFDCAHFGDLIPKMEGMRKPGGILYEVALKYSHVLRDDIYRDMPYVKQQTQELAQQLAKKGEAGGKGEED